MPKVSLVVIMLLQAVASVAQNYFVFIGSDNQQPFYVRLDSQFHGSSAEGHLILAPLKDSIYTITVGFPGQTQPEQHYSFNIDGKDQAFELRPQDAGSPDLRLYNLQSNQWLSPQGGSVASGEARSVGIKKDDAFSRMMAGVVHDTAVLYNTYAMERALSDSPTAAAPQSPAPALSATAAAQSPAQSPAAARSAPPPADTAASTTAVSPPPARPLASDSTVTATSLTTSKPVDTATSTAFTTASPATAPIASPTAPITSPTAPNTTIASQPAAPPTTATLSPSSADTAATHPAGVMTHQPAARFNDSSATASLNRPAAKDFTPATAPGVTKLSERHTTKNVRLVYADRGASHKADTIVVIIPVDSPAVAKTAGRQPHAADSNHIPAARVHGPNASADSPLVSSGTAYRPTVPPTAPSDATRPHPADSIHKPGKTIAFINSDCHDFASDFDVDKLRVRMLQSARDEDRIILARKEFKIKCFYTRQIRMLSEVFTSDAARFRFFEAAWPFAGDEHFHELSNLFTDPLYANKFKTMTHQQ